MISAKPEAVILSGRKVGGPWSGTDRRGKRYALAIVETREGERWRLMAFDPEPMDALMTLEAGRVVTVEGRPMHGFVDRDTGQETPGLLVWSIGAERHAIEGGQSQAPVSRPAAPADQPARDRRQ